MLYVPRPAPTLDELTEWHGRAEALVEATLHGLEDLDVDRDTHIQYTVDYHENLRSARREHAASA